MKSLNWAVFGLMAAAQLAVPFLMIAQRETVLEDGVAYKFRCGPVDPYDAFRGRYVALSFPDLQLTEWKGATFDGSETAYALLGTDEAGFVKILDVTLAPPANGDFLKVKAYGGGTAESTLWITLPFDRFYLEESKAPIVESAYWQQTRSEEGAYILVRVRAGEGVIEDLYFGDEPIEEYLRREAAKPVTEAPAQ